MILQRRLKTFLPTNAYIKKYFASSKPQLSIKMFKWKPFQSCIHTFTAIKWTQLQNYSFLENQKRPIIFFNKH